MEQPLSTQGNALAGFDPDVLVDPQPDEDEQRGQQREHAIRRGKPEQDDRRDEASADHADPEAGAEVATGDQPRRARDVETRVGAAPNQVVFRMTVTVYQP